MTWTTGRYGTDKRRLRNLLKFLKTEASANYAFNILENKKITELVDDVGKVLTIKIGRCKNMYFLIVLSRRCECTLRNFYTFL